MDHSIRLLIFQVLKVNQAIAIAWGVVVVFKDFKELNHIS